MFQTRILNKILFLISLVIVFTACVHDPDEIITSKPSNISYNMTSIILDDGDSTTNQLISIDGESPIYYTLSSSPATTEIQIDSLGNVSTTPLLDTGTYVITITGVNGSGTTTFPDVMTITVFDTLLAPLNLAYVLDTVFVETGNSGNSGIPTIEGTSPISYDISTTPDASGNITVASNGQIQVSSSTSEADYSVNITASNSQGMRVFSDVIVVRVSTTPVPPSSLTYDTDTLLVYQGDVETSLVNSITGTGTLTYSFVTTPSDAAITINSTDGTISVGAAAAIGNHDISVNVTNSEGNVDFTNVLHIKIVPDIVRFTPDILPLVQTNCTPCHTGGSQPNWTVYNNAKNNINNMLDRVQRTEGALGFMPNGGTKLSTAEINLLQQWLTDGLVE